MFSILLVYNKKILAHPSRFLKSFHCSTSHFFHKHWRHITGWPLFTIEYCFRNVSVAQNHFGVNPNGANQR